MLSDNDRELIDAHTKIFEDIKKYQEIPKYAFKGHNAFNIYLNLGLNHKDGWLDTFTDTIKNECLLLVTIQTTLSKAVLRNPDLLFNFSDKSKGYQRKIRIYFHINKTTHPSIAAYTCSSGQYWLKKLSDSSNNLI